MKRIVICAIAALGIALISGCTSAGAHSPTGFSSIIGPVFYTGATFPSAIQEVNLAKRSYKILGKAHGSASTKSIFFMVGFGDGGLRAATRDALEQYSNADDLVDLMVDTDVTNVFFLFTKVTTNVYGKAIQYTDDGNIK